MWNVDEKGLKLGAASRAKAVARAARELITAIECCGARQKTLASMVVFKGSTHHRSWYTGIAGATPGHVAYSPKRTGVAEEYSVQKPHQNIPSSTDLL